MREFSITEVAKKPNILSNPQKYSDDGIVSVFDRKAKEITSVLITYDYFLKLKSAYEKVEKDFWAKKFEEVKNNGVVAEFENIEELDDYLEEELKKEN